MVCAGMFCSRGLSWTVMFWDEVTTSVEVRCVGINWRRGLDRIRVVWYEVEQ
mgnify:CR=1 FL=1